jgi:ERF superfamily
MKEIATALVKAQSEMSNPKKGSSNPFFKSKYADLNSVREAVMSVLNENDISVLQPMVHVDGKNFIKTILLHSSGEMIESHTEIVYSKTNDAQAQGSGITYARRYGLQSLVCVGADDDDGNKASQPQKQTAPPAQQTAPPKPVEVDYTEYKKKLKECTTIETLGAYFKSLSPVDQTALSMYTSELKNDIIVLQKLNNNE